MHVAAIYHSFIIVYYRYDVFLNKTNCEYLMLKKEKCDRTLNLIEGLCNSIQLYKYLIRTRYY